MADEDSYYEYYKDSTGQETSLETYVDGYYIDDCDLVADICITYYASYYESGVHDNGYAWEYYLDPHGIPSYGWIYDPLGHDEESMFGTYTNYYVFIMPDYWSLDREDSVGCYSDSCVSYDWYYETCTSTYNDYYNVVEEENYYAVEFIDCGEDAYYYSYVESFNEAYETVSDEVLAGTYYEHKEGPEDFTDYAHFESADECYEEEKSWVSDLSSYQSV